MGPPMPLEDPSGMLARTVAIPTPSGSMAADLAVPPGARGLVVFAHGSGSGRMSPRNQAVAAVLEHAALGTLLVDLHGPNDDPDDFDLERLGRRLVAAIDWAQRAPSLAHLPIGCFGASTGAAVALFAAAERPNAVRGVVSRGGRADLAGGWLRRVRAPTLFLVGELDETVGAIARDAAERLAGPARVETIGGASHLFEEPGALERVARHALAWFDDTLARRAVSPRRGG